MFTPLRIGGLFATGAVILAACGGGTGTSAAGHRMAAMAMPAQAGGNRANAVTPVATDTVHIKNFAFSPATVTVKAVSTVVWAEPRRLMRAISERRLLRRRPRAPLVSHTGGQILTPVNCHAQTPR